MTDLFLDKVTKRFESNEIIRNVSLEIKAGEFVVFVGPSGCGKSTLLRMIAGLETVSEGRILMNGEVVNQTPPAMRGIAMVFQSYALYPHMTVYQNLAFGLQTLGEAKSEIETKVTKVAHILQIGPLLARKPKQLSGGQRQRVAIGRAIVRDPKVFLFDEPLSNLDAELRVQMRVEIAALHKELGTTMIYVTHDQVEAMTLAEKIVVLRSGNVEQIGSPLEIYNHPVNKFVAGFIGSPKMNLVQIKFLKHEQERAWFSLSGTDFDLPFALTIHEQELTLGLRPEHLVLWTEGSWLLGELAVTHTEQLGGQVYLYGSLSDGQSLTMSLPGQHPIQAGQKIPFAIDRSHLHVFDANGLTIQQIRPEAV